VNDTKYRVTDTREWPLNQPYSHGPKHHLVAQRSRLHDELVRLMRLERRQRLDQVLHSRPPLQHKEAAQPRERHREKEMHSAGARRRCESENAHRVPSRIPVMSGAGRIPARPATAGRVTTLESRGTIVATRQSCARSASGPKDNCATHSSIDGAKVEISMAAFAVQWGECADQPGDA
jgi:hypothetical protein